jgi:hypothetical protein
MTTNNSSFAKACATAQLCIISFSLATPKCVLRDKLVEQALAWLTPNSVLCESYIHPCEPRSRRGGQESVFFRVSPLLARRGLAVPSVALREGWG